MGWCVHAIQATEGIDVGLWRVSADVVEYDQYDSFIIRAATRRRAVAIARYYTRHNYGSPQVWTALPLDGESQGEGIVLGSYNAG